MWSEEHERRAGSMRERNERERLALRLGEDHLRVAQATAATGAIERHYTVQEIGALWNLSPSTISRMFRDEPGVLKIGRNPSRRARRTYLTLRIPQSVLERLYARLVIR
jgi:hypothetical protein